ncbi:MAG: hypothetical protein IT493_01345 [Gammaproteobacteria bacterium]|nr:hypothetical protein [Gammaproteobacteria bacterium]
MKSTLRALSLGASVLSAAVLIAPAAEARIMIDALGGEVKLEGYLSSEARANVGNGSPYLNQWIQRFELNAEVNYEDIGIFDTLSFVTVIRPEFDAAYYYGDDIGGGRGRNGTTPSYMGNKWGFDNNPVGFGGFDAIVGGPFGTFNTGGVGKLILNGLENPSFANNFETILNRTASGAKYSVAAGNGSMLSQFSPLTPMELNCRRCYDLDDDPLDVAMNNTGSSGRLYPFRELYVDATAGDWWFRVGKQQIVWGKTDFFRLQDLVNPVDFGQHFFFDSFEDIRIPQWIASAQWKFGNVGPTTDNAIQLVWNFDEFQHVGLGNPSAGWAHPFSKDIATFAAFNEYFSVEPCLGLNLAVADAAAAGVALNHNIVCGSRGPNDPRKPTGFGQPAGLSGGDNRPEWDIENTEAGLRWEFRLGELHIATSYYYGWNDTPIFRFDSVLVPEANLAGGAAALLGTADCTIAGLSAAFALPGGGGGACTNVAGIPAEAFGIPIRVADPNQALQALAANGTGQILDNLTGNMVNVQDAAREAIAKKDATILYRTAIMNGGGVSMNYKQSHTPGLSFDYFEPWSGIVFRVESSWTFDELVNNTRKANWVDTSEVMRWSIGMDRPTFIPWLNKDRTFFLSMQIFDTWYMDHEGDKHTGYFQDEHNFITTFFWIGNYMRDKVKPVGFVVWEEASNSYVFGQNVEWFIDNHWSIKGGLHMIWEGDENYRHDLGPYTSFATPGANGLRDPYNNSVFGVGREGIGALRNNDEVFFQLKYQF